MVKHSKMIKALRIFWEFSQKNPISSLKIKGKNRGFINPGIYKGSTILFENFKERVFSTWD